ncbi:MAG TPA: arsenate reductase ArsC [Candidatus Limnocylindrales bacterium]|nr:arsenate reductase ArsC [Candidatus Limnocylindrales bacterium]
MKTKVLFLCTGNSARSQMAEGYLRRRAGEQYEVLSAGTHPAGLNPLAVEAMRELGIDIAGQRSKSVSEFLGESIAYVITVCDRARESCPIFPGALHLLHWSFDDPAAVQGSHEEKLKAFRRVRDEIAESIDRQFAHTGPSTAGRARNK